MAFIIIPLLKTILLIITFFKWTLIGYAILSWLLAFNILSFKNPIVYRIHQMLFQLTNPLLSPLRSFIPNVAGLDLSFLVLFLIISFVETGIQTLAYQFLMGSAWL